MTKEEILKKHSIGCANGQIEFEWESAFNALDEYAKPYKEIAYLISSIFFYGNFKAETHNELLLEQKLRDVHLWPTTENDIIERSEQFIEQQNKE